MPGREVKRRFSAPTGGKPAAEIRQRCLSAAADFSGFCFGGTFFPSIRKPEQATPQILILHSWIEPVGAVFRGSGQLKSQHSRIVALRGTQTFKDSKPVLLLSRVTVSLLRPAGSPASRPISSSQVCVLQSAGQTGLEAGM